MADTLACRLCHRPLLDEAGCAVCLPIKPHLVPIEATDDDAVPLAQLAAETATLLRGQLKQLAVLQKQTNGYNAELAEESRSQAAALAKLLDSARKLQNDGADAIDCMSLQEKGALMLEFFSSLPPAYRRSLYERLGELVSNPSVQQEPVEHPIN